MVKRQALLGLILVTFLIGSCVPVPVYIPTFPEGRSYISEEQFKFLQVGKTQRRDVLLQFGGPFWTEQNDRFFVYSWTLSHGALIVFIFSPLGGGPLRPIPNEKAHYLCLEFAPDGTLKRFTNFSGDKAEEKIQEWKKAN
jgi:hypothetical protein